ncbi:Gfo/Idh/MocA family oxidoreductase [Dactylosporangium sp. NBC_01737]|uniref:Gfo/Idh/MocA family protein n=1 Tax=Dactylosporangium sp. NBC_01737 TaxID=2975959 RepID=UPI002E14D1A6|nr:Gfo/Idh/MocA family oxidoreductase [Dactylosporangium sp. NBC_01737]
MTNNADVLVGYGRIAEVLYGPELVAAQEALTVVEPSEERRAAAARLLPKATLLDSLDALPRAEGDAVALNLVPGPRHAEVTRRLLDLHHHVFSEKPAAPTPAQWTDLAALAQRSGRVLVAAPVTAYFSGVEALLDRVRDGGIGVTGEVHGVFTAAGPARRGYIDADRAWFFGADSCVIRDLAPYAVAPMVRLLGRPDRFTWYRNGVRLPVPVRPEGTVTPVHGNAAIGIGQWGDVIGRVEVAYRPWAGTVEASMTAYGSTGSLRCDLDDPPLPDRPGREKATGAFDLMRRALTDAAFRARHVEDVTTALEIIDGHRYAVAVTGQEAVA